MNLTLIPHCEIQPFDHKRYQIDNFEKCIILRLSYDFCEYLIVLKAYENIENLYKLLQACKFLKNIAVLINLSALKSLVIF